MEAPPGYGRLRSESSILALDPQRQAELDPRRGIRRHVSRVMSRMLPDVHFALASYGGVVRAQATLPFPCAAGELLPLVLRSPPVMAAMQAEERSLRDKGDGKAVETGHGDSVQKRARKAFGRLAADMRLWAVRWMGWILSQVWRLLYNNEIYVDLEGLKRVKALPPDMPVVYLPTHKSHMDYLLLSYVLFAYDMPVPHIAAGENLAIPLVGYLLRKSGAFFIRRSSRGSPDQAVYKAILNEYVMQLLASRRPLEFFIEGGRSRDGKVCPPKLGLLSVVVRALLTGQVDEVAVVPMAIAYDVVLEESSFVLEMTGVPKQPETLVQLVRAALHALRTRHGRVYVTVAPPFSLRTFLQRAMGCQLSLPLSATPSPACLQPPHGGSRAIEGRRAGYHDAVGGGDADADASRCTSGPCWSSTICCHCGQDLAGMDGAAREGMATHQGSLQAPGSPDGHFTLSHGFTVASRSGDGKVVADKGGLGACREGPDEVAPASTSSACGHLPPLNSQVAGAQDGNEGEDVVQWMALASFPHTGYGAGAAGTVSNDGGYPAMADRGPGAGHRVDAGGGSWLHHPRGSSRSGALACSTGMARAPLGAAALSPQEEWQLSILSGEAVVAGMRSALVATPTALMCTAFLAARAVLAPPQPGEAPPAGGSGLGGTVSATNHRPDDKDGPHGLLAQGLSMGQLATVVRWLSDQVATRGALVAHGGYRQVAKASSHVDVHRADESSHCGHCDTPAIRLRRHSEAARDNSVTAVAAGKARGTDDGGGAATTSIDMLAVGTAAQEGGKACQGPRGVNAAHVSKGAHRPCEGERDGIVTSVRWALRLLEASGAVTSAHRQPRAAAAAIPERLSSADLGPGRPLHADGPPSARLALSVADDDLESGEKTALLSAATGPAESLPMGGQQTHARAHTLRCIGEGPGPGRAETSWWTRWLGRLGGVFGKVAEPSNGSACTCACGQGAVQHGGGEAPCGGLVYDAPLRAEARLLMYYHMNQIMHLFAAEALLASALSRQLSTRAAPHATCLADDWSNIGHEAREGQEPQSVVADEGSSALHAGRQRGGAGEDGDGSSTPGARYADMMADAHWLHQLLRGELVPLIGEARERPWRRCMAAAMDRLVQSGEVLWSQQDGLVRLAHAPCQEHDPARCSKTEAQGPPRDPRVRARHPLLHFLLASLTPLLNTYLVIVMNLHALYHCVALDEKLLLSCAMEALEELSTAGCDEGDDSTHARPCFIPSTLVVQGAITSLVDMGVLVRRDAEGGARHGDKGHGGPAIAGGDIPPLPTGAGPTGLMARTRAKRDLGSGEYSGVTGLATPPLDTGSSDRLVEGRRPPIGLPGSSNSSTPSGVAHGHASTGAAQVAPTQVPDDSSAATTGVPPVPKGLTRTGGCRGSGGSGSGGAAGSPSLPRSLPSMRDFSFMPSIASVSDLPDLLAKPKPSDKLASGSSHGGTGLRGGGQVYGCNDKGGSVRKQVPSSKGGAVKLVLLSAEYAADPGKLFILERRIRSFMQPFPE